MAEITLTLTANDKDELVDLLMKLQEHLESGIEGCITPPFPDESRLLEFLLSAPVDEFTVEIEQDRKDWRSAEAWIRRMQSSHPE